MLSSYKLGFTCANGLYINKLTKILMAFIALFIGLMSMGIRLSSLTFVFLTITLFIYYLIHFPLSLLKEISKKILSSIPILLLISFIGIIISTYFIYFLNYKYLNNPFYFLSPPGFLENIFPNAVSRLDYKEISEALNLKNIPFLIKPFITILYSALSAEPIRYVLNKFRESNYLFLKLSSLLNYFGPEAMMVSILSFSPFTILPYFNLGKMEDRKKIILCH